MIGIIAEFDPFHRGHEHLIKEARRHFPGQAVVIAMSGHYTQRGGPAAVEPHVRAEMALHCGADLVLELPIPYAISSAEGFGLGGVAVLAAAGVDTLCFGSESGDTSLLKQAAECLERQAYPQALKEHLSKGISFAAARQAAVTELAGEAVGEALGSANDLLGVSYIAAIRRLQVEMEVCAIPRIGPQHNAAVSEAGFASASHIRRLMKEQNLTEALSLVPEKVSFLLKNALSAGNAPADLANCERAVLYRLRTMTEADFLALPDCSEGLENRLYRAAQQARSLEEFYTLAKSRRYAHSRIRRLTLWAFLGMTKANRPDSLPYLRVLGMNETGQQVLHHIRKTCPVPIVTKPAAARKLPEEVRRFFLLEMHCADLWRLCLPTLEHAEAGQEWRAGVVRMHNAQ